MYILKMYYTILYYRLETIQARNYNCSLYYKLETYSTVGKRETQGRLHDVYTRLEHKNLKGDLRWPATPVELKIMHTRSAISLSLQDHFVLRGTSTE